MKYHLKLKKDWNSGQDQIQTEPLVARDIQSPQLVKKNVGCGRKKHLWSL